MHSPARSPHGLRGAEGPTKTFALQSVCWNSVNFICYVLSHRRNSYLNELSSFDEIISSKENNSPQNCTQFPSLFKHLKLYSC